MIYIRSRKIKHFKITRKSKKKFTKKALGKIKICHLKPVTKAKAKDAQSHGAGLIGRCIPLNFIKIMLWTSDES